jgi:hypothetical protein
LPNVANSADFFLKPERSVYDVALLLGIAPMTVCQDERTALRKLRMVFDCLRVTRVGELAEVAPKVLHDTLMTFASGNEQRYPMSRPWHPVARIVSINGGCDTIREVVLTHQFLIERHPDAFAPPVLGRVGNVTKNVGTLGRALEYDGAMRVQVQSKSKDQIDPQSEITVLVESELGRDAAGRFEVPIVVAAFVRMSNKGEASRARQHGRFVCRLED